MNHLIQCRSCGRELPKDAPEGICPACVAASQLRSGHGGSDRPRSLPVEEVKRLFPDLEVLELLGVGGMGAVYKARQQQLDRLVALKILDPGRGDPGFVERFSREARTLARLSHPNIVAVHDFGRRDGLVYLLMELVDGVTLRHLLEGGKLWPQKALAIVPPICDALQYAHERGVIHRDIKPENILIDRDGRVKVADFGIARLAGTPPVENLTGEGEVLGTAHYMAPEQVERPGEVDHRADIYALGVVFYEMLTGELPLGKFPQPSRKVEIDVRLDEVVLKALEKEPQLRYQHASEVKSATEAVKAPPTPAAPTTRRVRAAAWLFQPYERIGARAALAAGLATIVATALAGRAFGVQTDGVLDLHYAPGIPLWTLLAQGAINWLSMVLVLLPFGWWLGSRSFRLLELLAAQALARFPYLVAVLYMGVPPVQRAFDWLVAGILIESALLNPVQPMPGFTLLRDLLLLFLLSIPLFVCGAWLIWLLYRGYAKTFSLSVPKAGWSFVAALVVAEVLSKFAIFGMLRAVL